MALTETYFTAIEFSSTLTRYSVINQTFGLTYAGNDYVADGLVQGVVNTTVTLQRGGGDQELTVLSDDDVIVSFRDETYRNREARIYRGFWDASTAELSDVVLIYQGVIDAIESQSDHIFLIRLISIFNRSTTLNASASLHASHTFNIRRGYYDGWLNLQEPGGLVRTSNRDSFFRNAGRDYSDFQLGEFYAAEIISEQPRRSGLFDRLVGLVSDTINSLTAALLGGSINRSSRRQVLGSEGYSVARVGEDWTPARVYGGSYVQAGIIHAFNPTPGRAGGIVSSWYGAENPVSLAGVNEETRFGLVAYCVHQGNCDHLTINFDGVRDSEAGTDSYQVRLDAPDPGYVTGDVVRTEAGHALFAYWVVWPDSGLGGGFPTIRALAGWDDDLFGPADWGLGYVTVYVLQEVTRDGPVTRLITPRFYVVNASLPEDPAYDAYLNNPANYGFASLGDYVYQDDSALFGEDSLSEDSFSFYFYFQGIGNTFGPIPSFGYSEDVPWTNPGTNASLVAFQPSDDTLAATLGAFTARRGELMFANADNTSSATFIVNSYTTYLELFDNDTPPDSRLVFFIEELQESVGVFDYEDTYTVSFQTIITLPDRLSYNRLGDADFEFGNSRIPVARLPFISAIYDYLTDPIAGPRLSGGDIDSDTFFSAFNLLHLPLYCNGALQGASNPRNYVDQFEDSSGLFIYIEGGLVKCFFGKARSASDIKYAFVDTISRRNVHSITIDSQNSDARYTDFRVRYDVSYIRSHSGAGSFVERRAQASGIETKEDSSYTYNDDYLTEDADLRNAGVLEAPFVALVHTNDIGSISTQVDKRHAGYQISVDDYCAFLLDKSRYPGLVRVIVPSEDIPTIFIGDLFTVEKQAFGWTGENIRAFIVVEYTYNYNEATLTITGQRHSNSSYDAVDLFDGVVIENENPVISEYDGRRALPVFDPVINLVATLTQGDGVYYTVTLQWDYPDTLANVNVDIVIIEAKPVGSDTWTSLGSVTFGATTFSVLSPFQGLVDFRVILNEPVLGQAISDSISLIIPYGINMPPDAVGITLPVPSKDLDFDLSGSNVVITNGSYETDGIVPDDDVDTMAVDITFDVTQACLDIPIYYRVSLTHENEGYEIGTNVFLNLHSAPPGTGVAMYLNPESDTDTTYFYGDDDSADASNSRTYASRPANPGTGTKFLFSSRSQEVVIVTDLFIAASLTDNRLTISYYVDDSIDLKLTGVSLEALAQPKMDAITLDNVTSSGLLWTFTTDFAASPMIVTTAESDVNTYYDTLTLDSVMIYSDSDTGVSVSVLAQGY